LTARRSSVTNMNRHGSIPGEMTATMYPISEFGFVDGHSGASTPGQGPVHGPRDRFKVVKIETSAPQKRGRWTCIEYADKNTSTASNSGAASTAVASAATAASTTTTTTAPTTAVLSDVLMTAATSTLSSVEPIVSSSEYDSIPIQQQQQQQQQQLLSPTAPTAKVPLSLVEEIESLLPVMMIAYWLDFASAVNIIFQNNVFLQCSSIALVPCQNFFFRNLVSYSPLFVFLKRTRPHPFWLIYQ